MARFTSCDFHHQQLHRPGDASCRHCAENCGRRWPGEDGRRYPLHLAFYGGRVCGDVPDGRFPMVNRRASKVVEGDGVSAVDKGSQALSTRDLQCASAIVGQALGYVNIRV